MPFATLLNKSTYQQRGGFSAGKLGTFLGVFTPTILTILGVIMYLRFGWVPEPWSIYASVRKLAEAFGARFGKQPVFAEQEADNCWLVNTYEAARLFGNPSVPLLRMVDWVADWLQRGGSTYDKPTGYGSRDGTF
jgi:hypothetical protein